jgi:hypothetical protein
MRSPFPVLVGLTLLWTLAALPVPVPKANAAYAGRQSGLQRGATTLILYGVVTPEAGGFVGSSGPRWGYGVGFQWQLSDRVALSLDGSRVASDSKSVAPFGLGLIYGSSSSRAVRPYVEGGAGYYRFTEPGVFTRALASSGNPRDAFTFPPSSESVSSVAWGGYLGAGVDWGLTSRVGIGAGVRAHNWLERSGHLPGWDGLITLRTGLSYRF